MKRWWLRGILSVVVVLAVVALGIVGWWSWPDALPDATGEQLFNTHSLGSPHATGIPYALALAALDRFPHVLGKDAAEFCEKFGTLPGDESTQGLPMGFAIEHDRRTGTEFLMTNCALCHTAEIDGQRITGLGNRNLWMNGLNQAILKVAGDPEFTSENMLPAAEKAAHKRQLAWHWRTRLAVKAAVNKLRELAQQEAAKPERGLLGVDGGPGRNSPIEFAKANLKVEIQQPHGYAKYPAMWPYRYRKTFGLDGGLVGEDVFRLAAVEFNKGMPSSDILRYPERWRRVHEYLQTVEAPKFPNKVDPQRVERGRALFTENCSHCHGSYAPDGTVEYEESIVPVEEIGTDPDRLRCLTDKLLAARVSTPFGQKVELVRSGGYVPPPLVGIWCRAPYLHNASVPTLEDLLRAPAERPVHFFLGDRTGYDLVRVGVLYETEDVDGVRAGRRQSDAQRMLDTHAPGNSNAGHEHGTTLAPEEKRALLEYLKQI